MSEPHNFTPHYFISHVSNLFPGLRCRESVLIIIISYLPEHNITSILWCRNRRCNYCLIKVPVVMTSLTSNSPPILLHSFTNSSTARESKICGTSSSCNINQAPHVQSVIKPKVCQLPILNLKSEKPISNISKLDKFSPHPRTFLIIPNICFSYILYFSERDIYVVSLSYNPCFRYSSRAFLLREVAGSKSYPTTSFTVESSCVSLALRFWFIRIHMQFYYRF